MITKMKLYNTASKHLTALKPLHKNKVRVYTCGPTVYQRAHIGNMRAYIFADILNRALRLCGYVPEHVINLTDVGHLTDDADTGEDKIEKQAKKENKSAKEIIEINSKFFFEDLQKLQINLHRYRFPKATEYIEEQIALAKKIEKQGYTYLTKDGLYFDTQAYKEYGVLGMYTEKDKEYTRIDTVEDKKHFRDFALWKLTPSKEKRQQEWDSPWGKGFPGWHIECSAMSMKLLGEQIDIHTGGMDHIQIHHNNEIAQSESVTKKKFSSLWLHVAFLTNDGEKLAKSLGNTYSLTDLEEKGYNPLSLRYLYLQSNYQTPLSFSFVSLTAAQNALVKLQNEYRKIKKAVPWYYHLTYFSSETQTSLENIRNMVADNLNTARVLALVWDTIHTTTLSFSQKRFIIEYANKILGIIDGNASMTEIAIPDSVSAMLRERDLARKEKDFAKADVLRDKIQDMGYEILDDKEESQVRLKK